ncbi:MAG TPA: HAMP domain-containing sensor histidine kinase [Flavobacteriales bacterium]|nr:HAMP domain-containing sensor histidine kinase [Flavobacteriales bacterium]
MKIRTRLAIRFTLIVASLLAIFAGSIYYFSASHRQNAFYERLEEKSSNYAKLISGVKELSPGLIQIFDKNTAYLSNERILIFNRQNKLLFATHEDSVAIPRNLLQKVRKQRVLSYETNDDEALAKLYSLGKEELVVFVSARDIAGKNQLQNLKLILVSGFLISCLVTMVAGWIFAARALKPISGVVSQVENINASRLAERVSAGSDNDEIGQLAFTFNRMLERIQQSFELQKSFVSNSSHELRTPLTSITGQLEVALMNKREPDEYKEVLSSVLEDIKSVNRLTNGLLELAQAEMDISKLKLKPLRIDELLWSTRTDLLKRMPNYTIHIELQGFPEEENKLMVNASEHLLRSAFINIMDNGCKFSTKHQVDVCILLKNGLIEILFSDEGIGISEEEIAVITQPFFRGVNAKRFPGHGLGLSLASKIVDLHNGQMTITSKINKFTKVKLVFSITPEN